MAGKQNANSLNREETALLIPKESYNSCEVENGRSKKNSVFENFVTEAKKRRFFDIYDLTSVHSKNKFDNYMESSHRALVCMFLQVIAPAFLSWRNINYLLTKNFSEDPTLGNLCNGAISSETTWNDIFSKFMCSIVVLYQIAKIHKYTVGLRKKPSFVIFMENKKFAVMKQVEWAYVGLVANFLCVFFCLIAAVVLTFEAKDPTTVILKAVTIFFLIEADSALLDMIEVKRETDKMVDETLVDFNNSGLKMLNIFSTAFLHSMFWIGPTFMFFCKDPIW